MPIHFDFQDNYKFPDCTSLKIYMSRSTNPVIKKYLKAIIDSGEKKLGSGLAAEVYAIGKNSVVYMTTDEDKYDYLSKYLGITDSFRFPLAKIKIISWDTDKPKWVYVFGAERLFLYEELSSDLRELWKERIDRLMFLYRELRKERGKEIFIIQDPEMFLEFCTRLVKKDPTWERSLEPIHKWAKEEGNRFPDVILDLKSANVLFRSDGSLAYIADPFSHTPSGSAMRDELLAFALLSLKQKMEMLDLMTDFVAGDISIREFREQLNNTIGDRNG